MEGHHLILGETVDYLTGKIVSDTHDERYRQKISRLLIEDLGYLKKEITSRYLLPIAVGARKAIVTIDFVITIDKKTAMIIKYGPGSLTTRHTPTIAMANLLDNYRIPIAVITNGESADVVDTQTAKIVAQGLDKIPSRYDLDLMLNNDRWSPIMKKKRDMAERIVYCYEIDGACPCDTTVCRLDDDESNT